MNMLLNSSIKFNEHAAELITADGTKFEIEQHRRLYYLYKNTVIEKRSENLKTWHQILGHCNVNDIFKLENVAQSMKINNQEHFDCEVCTISKQPNKRNREADVRAKQPFELVHTDLARPIDSTAKDRFKYVMIFTDDFSGCNFTYFLKEKSDASAPYSPHQNGIAERNWRTLFAVKVILLGMTRTVLHTSSTTLIADQSASIDL